MIERQQKIEVTTWDGKVYVAVPELYPITGKMTYLVEIEGQTVRFGGNPEPGNIIIPYAPAAELDYSLLEDIAKAIERATF
jgi:hypothetical protein